MRNFKKQAKKYWWVIPLIVVISLLGFNLFSVGLFDQTRVIIDETVGRDFIFYDFGHQTELTEFALYKITPDFGDCYESSRRCEDTCSGFIHPDGSKSCIQEEYNRCYINDGLNDKCARTGVSIGQFEYQRFRAMSFGIYIDDKLDKIVDSCSWNRISYKLNLGQKIKVIAYDSSCEEYEPSSLKQCVNEGDTAREYTCDNTRAQCLSEIGVANAGRRIISESCSISPGETIPLETSPSIQTPQDTSQKQPQEEQTTTESKPWIIASFIIIILAGLIVFLLMKIVKKLI